MTLASSVEALTPLPGIGPKTAARLVEAGIESPRDLALLLPKRYDDRRHVTPIGEIVPGTRVVTRGTVHSVRVFGPRWRRIMEVALADGDHKLFGMWFSNRRPKQERFVKGEPIVFAGPASTSKSGRLQMAHPTVIEMENVASECKGVVPVYPRIPKVPGKTIEKAVGFAVQNAEQYLEEFLPTALMEQHELMPICEGLRLVHQPPEDVENELLDRWLDGNSPAHRRLIFDELLLLQLALGLRRTRAQDLNSPDIQIDHDLAADTGALMGFAPTAAQKKVISNLADDLQGTAPMRRLLQGDVGSGKTMVALAAILSTVQSGHQAALMAPTSVLAEQHHRVLLPLFEKAGISSMLHTSTGGAKERKDALEQIAGGQVQVVIGTHALIQSDVQFKQLGLAVVDEQHRFGVAQRTLLVDQQSNGVAPHLLVMTATPIPRSLALTVYGDLDLSVLDELPRGRHPIATHLWDKNDSGQALEDAKRAVAAGRQVFYVCPVIEESESWDVTAATDAFARLSEAFPQGRVALLHGRLSPDEKEQIMGAFAKGETDLLVCTTVVEVGVDVPNATVMIIDGAERFGLAQLHQLRGRVGRSTLPSVCHLIGDSNLDLTKQRLEALVETNDGFEIARRDLNLRGQGELLGTKQAGMTALKYANLGRDTDLLDAARAAATEILEVDPTLENEQGRRLSLELSYRLNQKETLELTFREAAEE